MRTYNPDATCPKCGSSDIATRYAAKLCWPGRDCASHHEAPHHGLNEPAPEWEHMHRHCRGCAHWWLEAPLDAGEDGR